MIVPVADIELVELMYTTDEVTVAPETSAHVHELLVNLRSTRSVSTMENRHGRQTAAEPTVTTTTTTAATRGDSRHQSAATGQTTTAAAIGQVSEGAAHLLRIGSAATNDKCGVPGPCGGHTGLASGWMCAPSRLQSVSSGRLRTHRID